MKRTPKRKTKKEAREQARRINCELKYSGKTKKVYIHRLVSFNPLKTKK